MTSSRTTYAAGTPDRTTFFRASQDDPTGIRLPATSTNGSATPLSSPGVAQRVQSSWRGFIAKTREVVNNNSGMLLVAASQVRRTWLSVAQCLSCDRRNLQGFFSLMNVAVKKLNSLDPPVSAMELIFVRMVRSSRRLHFRCQRL